MAASWHNMQASLPRHGVRRINVSVDTLDEVKFKTITRWGDLAKVKEGIRAAQGSGARDQDQRRGAEGRQ